MKSLKQLTCLSLISFLVTAVVLLFPLSLFSQTVFWTENFENPNCASLCNLNGWAGVNGTWNVLNSGGNGGCSNLWYRSCAENGNAAGGCGSGCSGSDESIHIGNVSCSAAAAYFCPSGDCGAAYDASGAPEVTDKLARSPVIDCSNYGGITLDFNYIENGQGASDNFTLWYYDGGSWAQIANPAKTALCGGQGLWTAFNIGLPASADNNANVRVGFRWVNNGDGVGSDPSVAIDDITVSYNVLLPIELLSFEANKAKDKTVKLSWTTATETNNDYYTIERSADALVFSPIGKVDGAGNSSQIKQYRFTDDSPGMGVNYYRLKQTDYDGKYKYSNLVAVNIDSDNMLEVIQLAVLIKDEFLTGKVYAFADFSANIEVLDMSGKQIMAKLNSKFSQGENTLQLNVKKLPSGTYFLKFTDASISMEDTGNPILKRFVKI